MPKEVKITLFSIAFIAMITMTVVLVLHKQSSKQPELTPDIINRIKLEALTSSADGQLKIVMDEIANLKKANETTMANFKTVIETFNNHRDNFRLIETSIGEQSKQIVKLKQLMEVITKAKEQTSP